MPSTLSQSLNLGATSSSSSDNEIKEKIKDAAFKYEPEEDDEISKKPSVVWSHVITSKTEDITWCQHCDRTWHSLRGSASTPLKHIKNMHYDKLTEDQQPKKSQKGETSGCGGPLPRSTQAVKRLDGLLARVLISSMSSWSLLQNAAFGDFCAEFLAGRYTVPSCEYVLNNVLTPMLYETKCNIQDTLKKTGM